MIGVINGGKEVAKLANTGLNLLDKIFYTKQERAEGESEARQKLATYTLQWLDSQKGQNVARRIIAIMITSIWCTTYAIGVALAVAAVFAHADLASKLVEASAVLKDSAEEISPQVMLLSLIHI